MRSKDHTHHWKKYPPCKLMPSRWIDLPMTAICPLPENKIEAYFTFLEKRQILILGWQWVINKFVSFNAIGVRTPPSIWYAFGPYKEVSLIYLFIFSNLSDVLKKKWEVGETCAASRGIFNFQFSSLFHTCYCNASAIFKHSVPKQQTTTEIGRASCRERV